MGIETAKESLTINHIINQKIDTMFIEEDCIVPDVKPDILNIIGTRGIICVYKKEILEGKVKIEGCINTYIMYLADTQENNTVRVLNTNLDFTQIIDIENVNKNMELDTNLVLKSLDCKTINGRKVSVKAIIEAEVKISSNEKIEYITEIQNLKDIQILNKEYQINSLIGKGSTKIHAKDILKIDEIDNLIEIMKTDLKVSNKDVKVSYNKILIKADLDVKMLYSTEDNRIKKLESRIPIVGFVDLPDISEEHECNIKYEIENLIIKPNNVEEHSILLEAEIEVSCEAYENKKVNMIQDLYSPSINLKYSNKKIRTMQRKETKQQTFDIKEQQNIPEIQSKKIYDVEVTPQIEKQNISNGKINYEGNINLNYIYATDKINTIETKKTSIPFKFVLEFDNIKQENEINTLIEVTSQDFMVMQNDNIEVKIELTFTIISSKNSELSIIEKIEKIEDSKDEDEHSMVIYFTKPKDSLWNIAKKFKGTVNEISRVNGIQEAEEIKCGRQLFIPRYHG